MKVGGFFPQDGVEGKLKLFDQNGEEVKAYDEEGNPITISRWEWEPAFFAPSARPVVQYLQTVDGKGNLLRRAVLVVSGASGRCDLQDRTKPVAAAVDAKPEKKPKADSEPEPEPEKEEPKLPKGKG